MDERLDQTRLGAVEDDDLVDLARLVVAARSGRKRRS
jgi:hypothetical protein